MKDVKRFRVYLPGQFDRLGNNREADVVYATDYDAALSKLAAETLRADTAEAELAIWKTKACEAADREIDALQCVAVAEQRIAELEAALTEITPWAKGVGSKALKSRIYSILNIVRCEKCLGAGFIGFDDTKLRSLNGGAWGRCLACRPYAIEAALNPNPEAESHE